MSWVITPQLKHPSAAVSDPDARAYLLAVEQADGQFLEAGVATAINTFVTGCKQDGIWNAIKASCILAGARTLTGALVPLVGTAPTNVGPFVSGDYNRKMGLVGDGSTKYLDSNRNNNTDPQNSNHVSVHLSTLPSVGGRLIGFVSGSNGDTALSRFGLSVPFPVGIRSRNDTLTNSGITLATGFVALSRSVSTEVLLRNNASSTAVSITSLAPSDGNIEVFRASGSPINARLAFYSIGESLNLALLDARVTDLINAFAAVIP